MALKGCDCDGRHIGLFLPDVGAPGAKALAGNQLGAVRGRSSVRCDGAGGLSTVALMAEDLLVSEVLDTPEVTLCGLCAETYDKRRTEHGCVRCGERLACGWDGMPEQHATVAAAVAGHCALCALASVSEGIATVVGSATSALSAELAQVRAERDELQQLRAASEPRQLGHPKGVDGVAPARDRCGAELGHGAAGYQAAGGVLSLSRRLPPRS